MSYLGSWKIDDALTFYANTQVFATGVATDADAVPAYRVYEDETATPILTGTMALLNSADTAGFYSEQITLSAANGFEKGKCYSIYISATVSGVAGATHRTLQIEAEVDANSVSNIGANVITATAIANGAIDAATFAAGAIDATAVADGAIDAATFAANSITAAALAADAGAEIADAVLNRDMSTGTDSGSTTVRTPRQALRFLRNKWDIAGGTLTVTKEDDTTASWTAAVTSTAGDPISGSDPAGP